MSKQPNIVFLMLDTVRADVMSPYGGKLKLKNIDRLAKKSVVFHNAISPGTYTLPSHLSIFLGKRPRAIKKLMRDNIKHYDEGTDPFMKKSSYIGKGEVTLAQNLSYMGYDTALFSNNPFLSPFADVSRGFNHIDNMFVDDKLKGGSFPLKVLLQMINIDIVRNNVLRLSAFMAHIFPDYMFDGVYLRLRKKVDRHYSDECGYYKLDSGAKITNRKVRRHMSSADGRPKFLFLNYMEGHEGYPTNLITSKYIAQDKWLHIIKHNHIEDAYAEKAAYEKRISYLDGKIGEVIANLKSNGALENAYLIITADHGQAFMEHEQMYHNLFPYNELVRVPLIISRFKNGNQVGSRENVNETFSLTALNKIIKQIASGETPTFADSVSNVIVSDHLGITEVWDTYLLKLIKSRSASADKIYQKKRYFNRFASAIFYGNYKLMHFYGRKKDELYSLDDKKEEHNIIDKKRDLAQMMIRRNDALS